MERQINNAKDCDSLIRFLGKLSYPFTVRIRDGRMRSLEQNHLYWMWATQASIQSGNSLDRTVAEWKLNLGLPILCADEWQLGKAWQAASFGRTYEDKLDMMPLIDVTSIMSQKQMKQYLDEIQKHSLECGIELTDPEERRSGTVRGRGRGARDKTAST
jgi:hypothetical protein